ncbi:hypothetical protein [Thermococcus sp. 2319x1]|uniref:hypothetical protein n=1 Tax=Thermococcus sp. 2319x1 TaxID=1674923 RepID=UPI001187370A|nr:hypothetical protein [Thermococcus sp. 2319x1]
MGDNVTYDSALVKGTIARTDKYSGMPHLDELTHHLIAVSIASLKFDSPEVVMAALIHDYFKPVFDIRVEKRTQWYHFITDRDVYNQLLTEFSDSLDISKVASISQWHHKNNSNEISHVENSELISAIEIGVPFDVPTNRSYTVAYNLKIPGKYRMFLLALIKDQFTRILSEKYSERLQEVLGVKGIRYEYRPIGDNGSSKIEEVGEQILREDWKITFDNDTLVIPLPSKFHTGPFYFEYYEGADIVIDFDKKAKVIRGIKIPLGKASSTVYLVGSREAYLVYVDAGFEPLHLQEIIEELLDYLRSSLSEKKRKAAFTGIELDKVVNSLTGHFSSDRACLFCGEPGEPITDRDSTKSILKNKFTDTWSFLSYEKAICPACKLGFEIEENFRSRGLIQYLVHEAIIEETKLLASVPIFKQQTFVKSISSKIWLELISDIYYSLHKEQDKMNKKNTWLAKFYLDPAVIVYPYALRIIPQISLVSSRYPQKKFVLQSGLHSNVVFPGNEKDMTPEEFARLRKFYSSNLDLGMYLLKKIRSVYSPTFGIPKVDTQKGGGSRARKGKG